MISEFKQLTTSTLAFILLLTSATACSTNSYVFAKTHIDKAFLQTPETVLETSPQEEKSTKVIRLKSGEIITHCRQRLIVEAPNAHVTICPGAVVIVTASDKLTRILACWENSSSCVSVVSAGSTRTVRLGGELSIAVETDTDEAEKILSATNLRRRRVQYARPKDGLILVDAQFSLMDIVLKDPLLHSLNEEHSQEAKSIISSVNKAAAAISIVSSKEPYSLIDQP